ncbi:MAG: FKBP-type peptidyl-prolyl cis-trans isomerase [Prevotella sp.]|nr:FKBP-type peptidyl-prolyl cis-trans isomerase [Prevotella sp.]
MDNITHKYVVLSYKLYTKKDGGEQLVEEAGEEKPFSYLSGFGMTLEAFEEETVKLKTGDEFDFTLPKEKAYGEYDPEHVIDIDKTVFTINNHFDHEHIYKDAIVPLQNEDGNHFLGRVLAISDDKVKMDLNHPLAGQDLNFRGKVIELRDATDNEVDGFIKHIEQHHCGCGCDDCGDGCSHDHKHEGGCGCGHCH